MNKTAPSADRQVEIANRDQVHVNLLGLGPRLRERAALEGVSLGCAVRMAVAHMLEDAGGVRKPSTDSPPLPDADADPHGKTRLLLRVSAERVELLVTRARECGVSRSRYVEMLMDGGQPLVLPVDHAAMVAALMTSNDLIAALSVDLRAFMRLLGTAPATELHSYRARLGSLIDDVRAHLKPAAAMLAELESTRRWR